MKLHEQRYQQFLPISLEEAWDFFSAPQNLNEITPDDMNFEILTKEIPRMYAGQIVQYNVKPFPFFTTGWVTEITHVEERRYFVDEQRFGPYAMWHHQHHFQEQENGVLMTDILHYRVPLGIVGKLVNTLFIQRKVKGIFEYRFKLLENKFGKPVLTKAENN
ncbi:MAG: SRPBCC family protein [Flavobacteriales bacterium]|nr:SRPBCC family protein [Flavobacteriales bacterium]